MIITGRVNSDLEAAVEIAVQDNNGNLHSFRCIVDTGFDGFLALPVDIIQQLGLVYRLNRTTVLLDGVAIFLPVYLGLVDWRGELLEVTVLGTEQDFLVGMALLENSTLTVEVWDGGEVRIEPR